MTYQSHTGTVKKTDAICASTAPRRNQNMVKSNLYKEQDVLKLKERKVSGKPWNKNIGTVENRCHRGRHGTREWK